MAKIPFTKLKCKINEDSIPVQIGEETIAVKQYLPVQEKLELIGNVVMAAHEQDANYSNPVKAEVYRDLEVVFAYTNITFTDKQKEDLPKLYDQLASTGILEAIIKAIPEKEYANICCGVWNSIESVYKYQNSVLGLVENLAELSEEVNFNLNDFISELKNSGDNLSFLKDVLTKLG